jgi:predicted metal-dependent HD superfamily phosphohydrolase
MNLHERFSLWWSAVGATGNSVETFLLLENQYEKETRYYHTLTYHICAMLQLFDTCRDHLTSPLAVEGAIFFHDLFDDEEETAVFTEKYLLEQGISAELVTCIKQLILKTLVTSFPETTDEKYIVDIDRASLGLPFEEFRRNTALLGQESPLSGEAFALQTQNFFRYMLSQKRIYYTSTFTHLEPIARKNMQTTLDLLS